MAGQKRGRKAESSTTRSGRHLFYPKGRRGGVVIRIQTDYSPKGQLLRYSLALIDTMVSGIDGGRILGYDNAHGHHHRHYFGQLESIEFQSYESIERRFEAEVRKYLESGEV